MRKILIWFCLTRALAFGATHLGARFMTAERRAEWTWQSNDDLMPGRGPDAWMAPQQRWDAYFYVALARLGYPQRTAVRPVVHHLAFFPLFPLALRGLEGLGMEIFWAAFLLSNAAALLAALVLARLGGEAAALLFLASPGAHFLLYPYPEALFALFLAAGMLFIERDRPLFAMLAAAAATATRSAGVVLPLAMAVVAWQRRREPRRSLRWLAAAALGLSGLGAFALFCREKYGDALAFAHAQATHGRVFSLIGPVRALLRFNVDPDYYLVTLAVIAAAIVMLRRRVDWRSISAAFLLLLPMATGTLAAMIRYQAVNLPVIEGAASILHGRPFRWLLWGCLALMCVEALLFGMGIGHY